MPIYRFGADVGQLNDGSAVAGHTDFRSDIEQRNTPVALHDPTSQDLMLARKLVDEMINVSGAEVKVYLRTDNADFDKLWDADADPTYWNPKPMKAFLKPQPLELELKKWGADIENKIELSFSFSQVYIEFNDRMLRTGDVISLPYNATSEGLNPKYYRVTNAAPSGNFRYNWLYFTCQATLLTADITVRPVDASPMAVDEMPEKVGYRESI